ncbi:molybdenum cofactor guanylyltransferase [Pontibacter rugosus]|uniref:Probable molybdenum cofactor guanylyltransferase n=1 Tax=Pontibacter rugosus TaxID=1745966 RepID=A0ABW3SLI6_9BACT
MADKAELYGLVLAGGKSTRMGTDKGLLDYKGMPHRDYLYQLLDNLCAKTFLGLRTEQQQETQEQPVIWDDEYYQGPFRSLLSAHKAYPDKAWLVVACDLPFLTDQAITKLIEARDAAKPATAYYNEESGFLEPLIAIWEPEALEQALLYAADGNRCPRKFLMSQDIKQLPVKQGQELVNANYPEDYEQAKEALS